MKIITEKLNKLDLKGIDNNNYYDLRNLYEAVEPRMTSQDKQELKKLIDVTDNPETISAYLKSKDEDLNEDTEDIYEPSIYENMATEVNKYLQDNEIHPEDVFETSNGFTVEIEGDWKHDHMKTDMLLNSYFNDNNIIATIDIVPIDDDGSDFYTADHVVRVLSLQENLQLKNISESYLTEEKDIKILSLVQQIINLLSQVKSIANNLVIELEDKKDKINANSVNVDILLGLDESGIYDTLEDIAEEYKEGITNE